MQQVEAPTPDELLQAALEYARAGWAVFALHTPINGVCDCADGPTCKNTGKHPRTLKNLDLKRGLLDATTDELKIRRWWKACPIANIGLTVRDGYGIVDVDGTHGIARLEEQGWALPPTAVQSSGRGAHYVYRVRNRVHPRILIKESEKDRHDGVDLRGPGSYVVAAPSLHASGRVYEWAVPLSQVEIAPAWLEKVAEQPGGSEVGARGRVDFGAVLAGISEGSRKLELYRAAAKLRAADVPMELAIMLAQQAAANCRPPLEPTEAERKVREVYAKYPPNASVMDLPSGVTLLAHDSVMVEFETCRFVFSDMEKTGRELRAEMEVKNLLPAMAQEPYVQSLNLLSPTARDQCRREIEHVLGTPPGSAQKGHWVALLSRAVTNAQSAYLNVDRSISTADMPAPEALEFIVPDLVVAEGINILFGTGSGGKTWLLMELALCVSLGLPFLGRPTKQMNVLYSDHETGPSTYAYRMRRLCAAKGLTLEGARNVRFWNGKGLPFADQVQSMKRACDQHEIGVICLDHIAAACGGDASEQSIASDFARGQGKIGLPMVALAHITGSDMRNPESVDKPFGSIFWHNNARRTTFVMRQQEAEASVADLGLYPKKVNDGRWPKPFGARVTFVDPSGPVAVEPDALTGKGALDTVRGLQHVIYDLLTPGPMLAEKIADQTGKGERHVKDVMKAHPRMFVDVTQRGPGEKSTWARVEIRVPYSEPEDVTEDPDETPW